jgi:hypothetical protein
MRRFAIISIQVTFRYCRKNIFMFRNQLLYLPSKCEVRILGKDFIYKGFLQDGELSPIGRFIWHYGAITVVRLRNPNVVLSFNDLSTSNLVLAVLGAKGFKFSSTDRIFQLNSIPSTEGSLDTSNCIANTIERLECGTATTKIKSFVQKIFFGFCKNVSG